MLELVLLRVSIAVRSDRHRAGAWLEADSVAEVSTWRQALRFRKQIFQL
jgi:hypothetical protein